MWINKRYLLLSIAFALPFFLANAVVALQEEFFLSFLRPFGEITNYEEFVVLALIALMGVGGVVALLPILKERRLYIVNAIVGVVFIAFTLFVGYSLGYDFYKCDIIQIPNCD